MVVKAATTGALADRLVVSEDQSAIGLKKAWTDEQMDENIPLTLVLGNLPLVEQGSKEESDAPEATKQMRYVHTTDEIKDLFTQYGKVALCRLRFRKNHSSGSDKKSRRFVQEPLQMAFVEFESQQECEKAMAETLTVQDGKEVDPKRKLTLGDAVLTVRTLADYVQERKALKDQDGDRSDADSKKRNRDANGDYDDVASSAFTVEWKPGCVIRLEGLPANCDREAILDSIAQGLDVTVDQVKDRKIYADFSRGQKDGAIRFVESDNVAELCEKLGSGDVTIAGAKVDSAKVLEGDEEKKYWEELISFKNKQLSHKRDEKTQHRNKKKHFRR